MEWHRDWAFSLFKLLAQDDAESRWDYLNALGYEEWEGDYRWGRTLSDPRHTTEEPLSNIAIIQVVASVSEGLDSSCLSSIEEHGITINLPETLKNIEEDAIIPLYKKYKLPFKPYEIAFS